jgi:hypothetical protein
MECDVMNNLQRRKRAFMSLITRPLDFFRIVLGVPPLSLPCVMEGKADRYVIEGNSVQGKNLWTRGDLVNISVNTATDITLYSGSYTLSATITSSSEDGKSVILGYKVSDGSSINLGTIPNNTGARESCMISIPEPINRLRIYAASTSAKSTGQTFSAINVQLEKGVFPTEYQSTIPSPENPFEIKSVGENTVNLFDMNKLCDYGFVRQDDGVYTLNSPTSLNNYTSTERRIFTNDGYEGQMKLCFDIMYPATATNMGVFFDVYYTDGTQTTDIFTVEDIIFGEWNNISFITPSNKQVSYVLMSYNDNIATTFRNVMITEYTECDYEPYGKYKIPITNRGVNLLLFPFSNSINPSLGLNKPITTQGVTFIPNSDGSITINGTSNAGISIYLYNNKTSLLPGLKVGDTITISKNPDDVSQQANVYLVYNYYNAEGTMKTGALASTRMSGTKVIFDDWVGSGIYIHVPKEKTINNLTIKPQIQIGSDATDYEPYREPITTSIFLDEPLRGIGDYKDIIDFESGTLVRRIVAKAFDGSENWAVGNKVIYLPWNGIKSSTDCLCTHLPNNDASQSMSTGTLYIRPVTDVLRIIKSGGSYTDVDEWKALLEQWNESGNPFTVATQLSTPKTESITLPELPLFEDTNVISIDGDVQPEMKIRYKSKKIYKK